MKKAIFVLLLIASSFTYSQSGKIYPKNPEIKSGEENIYIYEPSKGILIDENSLATIVYEQFNKKYVPLIRKENKYEFSIKVPDSISVLIIAIHDKKNNVVDSNSDKGFVVFLKNKTKEDVENANLSYLSQSNLANYFLQLKIPPTETITQFEKLYQQNPKLKEDASFDTYLHLKFENDKENSKPDLITRANFLALQNNEKSLIVASEYYALLKMFNENDKLIKLILEKYPKGELAKRNFFNAFYGERDKTEQYILDGLKNYTENFNDYSEKIKNQFYTLLIGNYLKNKDTLNLNKYENLITDKLYITNAYNNYAWELSGQDLTSAGTDLNFAEKISKKTVDIVKNRMLNPRKNEQSSQFIGMYNMFSDTYALILYKQKKYDLAFQYEHEIALQDELDTGGKERYASIAEKAKGSAFAKDYLEKQLSAGVDSKIMINHLQEIYKKLNLPEDEFEKIKTNALKLATQKAREELIKIYGDIKAIDFNLTNLKGEIVKLSDYKGKMVVLDFWATWCGPCRASFPKMQELVTKYKDDNIEFFFINTWERTEPTETKLNVAKYITDNNYSFNVLYDIENIVVKNYKIEGIPTKILIDKEGNIMSINSSEGNLVALIEENI